jgi:predicted DNA-binding transcriptional regulator AlpA
MATLYCDVCHQEVRFLSLQNSMKSAGVCRSTVYYWMERGWIHWRVLPSGRRLICHSSLSRPAGGTEARSLPPPSRTEFAKPW